MHMHMHMHVHMHMPPRHGRRSRRHARHRLDATPWPSPQGDGVVTLQEFQDNLKPKTRKKIEMKLEGGWTFDADKWKASCDRHAVGE